MVKSNYMGKEECLKVHNKIDVRLAKIETIQKLTIVVIPILVAVIQVLLRLNIV